MNVQILRRIRIDSRRIRILELCLVLSVTVFPLILNSVYVLINGMPSVDEEYKRFRSLYGLITEAGGIALLIYVLFRQGRCVAEIGLSFRKKDIPHSIGLAIAGYISSDLVSISELWCSILDKKLRFQPRSWVQRFTVQRFRG